MGSRWWWSRLTNRKTQCHVSWKTIRGEYVWEYRSEDGYIGGEIGKEKWMEGLGPWLGSPRHWGARP